MKFNEMLTYWNLKGVLEDASSHNPHAGFKKIKVRLNPDHVVFIRYNKDGPWGASVYFDNDRDFKLIERIGVTEDATPPQIVDCLTMWIKDLL